MLIEFSKIIFNSRSSSRSLIARLGGDEFLCILVNSDHANILDYVKKIDKGLINSQVFKKIQ